MKYIINSFYPNNFSSEVDYNHSYNDINIDDKEKILGGNDNDIGDNSENLGSNNSNIGDNSENLGGNNSKIGDNSESLGGNNNNIGNNSKCLSSNTSEQTNNLEENLICEIVSLTSKKRRLPPETMMSLIVKICSIKPLSAKEIGNYLNRDSDFIRKEYISKLVKSKKLSLLYSDTPQNPSQKYYVELF